MSLSVEQKVRNRKNKETVQPATTTTTTTTETSINTNNNTSSDKQQQQSQKELGNDSDVSIHPNRNSDDHTNGGSAFLITPLVQRQVWARLDVGPFLLLYTTLLSVDIITHGSGGTAAILVSILLGCCLVVHLVVVLSAQWKLSIKAKVGYRESELSNATFQTWTHCLVQASREGTDNSYVGGIVPVRDDYDDNRIKIIQFQDRIFRCNSKSIPDTDETLWIRSESKNIDVKSKLNERYEHNRIHFRPVKYPVDLPLDFYSSWTGHDTLQSAVSASRVYGDNSTILQLPSFLPLLSEQLLAPFFLFQVFCVVLWSLDEYWYYALFTLFALLTFESTVAYNRISSLKRLHQVSYRNKNQRIWVRRSMNSSNGNNSQQQQKNDASLSQWISVFVSELVPGDWVSLTGTHVPVPADILLLHGTAVCDESLLTGESVPQLKQPLDLSSSNGINSCLDIQGSEYKESLLFGGTNLIVGTPEESSTGNKVATPQLGVEGIVLRTGFETAQGSLLRTMAHSSKSADGVHTVDSFVFILVLIVCAIVAACYVLYEGWYDEKRNRFRLILHVIIIVTSVVPPELPMELSLAVTNSVAALMTRCKVYCTEHFRIPWAGEVDMCCFDKTGTLTSDEMILKGVRVFEKSVSTKNSENILHPDEDEIPWPTLRVMAGCHSLAIARITRGATSEVSIVGDPLEQTVLKQSGFQLIGNNIVALLEGERNTNGTKSINIVHRFPFSSKMKRMTTLVTDDNKKGQFLALTKGAPETIKDLLRASSIPHDYDDVSFYHMSKGRRVLAMAYRELEPTHNLQTIKESGRAFVEIDLVFAGFLILECPLKPDSKSVISELKRSKHRVVMITGDAILTAAEVSRQVGIILSGDVPVYRIQFRDHQDESKVLDPLSFFEYKALTSQDIADKVTLSYPGLKQMRKDVEMGNASFCITGDTLVDLAVRANMSQNADKGGKALAIFDEKQILMNAASTQLLTQIVPCISVFARHAPHQKEAIVAALNHAGYHTLMCGDGTNDVGALKRAHVGISLISAPEIESKQRVAGKKLSKLKSDQKRANKETKTIKKSTKRSSGLEESLRQLREAQEELDYIELGDASVAAPFTSRSVSIKCCKDIIQQGRCTLVTMLQIYKILGVNCLVNALVLSKLFLHGVKQGDRQLTVLGLAVAALFFFVTRSEPIPVLSEMRPPSTVLCAQALLSIAGQFLVHFGVIMLTTHFALIFVDSYDPSLVLDGPFNPNVLNSCTFLLTCLATVNTFAVNYRGRPFMQDLRENTMLYRALLLSYLVLTICALEAFPPIGDMLQMTELPTIENMDQQKFDQLPDILKVVDFKIFLLLLMLMDTLLVFFIEHQLRNFFDKKSS